MQLSNLILLTLAEVCLVLIFISGLLLFQILKQRKTIRRQQDKLEEVLRELRRLKLPPPPAAPGTSYKTYLQSQQTATVKRLQGTYPNFSLENPATEADSPEARALALRLQLLQIEESAIEKGDGPLKINWQYLETQLANLLTRPTEPAPSSANTEDIETYKKRIENLEKFKTLFFDMERQWQIAQAQSEDYHAKLSALAGDMGASDNFIDLLGKYQTVYQGLNQSFVYGAGDMSKPAESEIEIVTVTRIDPRAGEEIIRLRNVAADQHRIINQLQRKLDQAATAEAREEVIVELQQQLQRQTRFVQESETCIRLLEDELSAAGEKIVQQQRQLSSFQAEREETAKAKATLEKFTLESKELVKTLLDLESENAELKRNLKDATPDMLKNDQAAETDTTEQLVSAREALKTMETRYSALEREYALLEEKYLELKMK
jgi:hypothetical protein